jgi:hypothetical protein
MADADSLARRAVDAVNLFARRGIVLALAAAVIAGFTALMAYLVGLAALSGGARSLWVVIGGALVVVAAGAPLLAAWRLHAVRRNAGDLVGEVQGLVTGNVEAERIVIDAVEAEDATAVAPPRVAQQRALVQARQFNRLRTVAVTSHLRKLPRAMTALASFPVLIAIALGATLVSALLGFVFLLVWIF